MEERSFGRYRLVELVGRGGMGEVWRAFDTAIDRVVALKLLPAHLADDEAFKRRFRREARAAAALDDPHVVPIHDIGEVDGHLFVTMRLINGQDLQGVLADGPIHPRRAVDIMGQVASALHAAHQIGLVHRDVKPSNILLAADDFAYLIDFGIARTATDTALTGTGMAIGTWAYMAPERFASNDIDQRVDVYALACVLHECLTGTQPFPADSLERVMFGHMFTPPPRPSALQSGVPSQFDAVIAVGLAKKPEERFATCIDLVRAAREAIDGVRSEPTLVVPPREFPAARTTVAPTPVPQPSNAFHAAETQASPQEPPILIGGWAKVVVGDKRYLGRIGKVVSIDAMVGLKFTGTIGTFRFAHGDVVASPTESGRDPARPATARQVRKPKPSAQGNVASPSAGAAGPQSNSTEVTVGGWAKVVVGDQRYLGRVGRVTSNDDFVRLKFKGTLGTYPFRADHVQAVDGPGG